MSSRILPQFELFLPESVDEVIECLKKYGEKAAVMAGGTDLMVRMKAGLAPEVVVSLAKVKGLDYVTYGKTQGLRIGAMATINQVIASPDVQSGYAALYQSACENGTVQTRNTGTVVGNLLNASPAADCACAVLAMGGYVVLQGPEGTRNVDIDDFWVDYRTTQRKPDEMALEVVIPPHRNCRSAFGFLTRIKKDLAKINAAASFAMDGGVCKKARLAMGAVAPTHIRLKECEAVLEGKEISEDLIQKAIELVPGQINPISDVRSTAEYRHSVSGDLMARVIRMALNLN